MNVMKERIILIEAKINGYWDIRTLKKINDDIYIIGEQLVTREKMIEVYTKFRGGEKFSQKITDRKVSKEEILTKYKNAIDEYTEYIEDSKQQKRAETNNKRLMEIIDRIEAES